jgi:hypothetical protein
MKVEVCQARFRFARFSRLREVYPASLTGSGFGHTDSSLCGEVTSPHSGTQFNCISIHAQRENGWLTLSTLPIYAFPFPFPLPFPGALLLSQICI